MVLLRRHTAKIKRFNEIWYREIKTHSHCDQLSFDYAARKTGIKYAHFPGTIFNNPHFARQPHVKILKSNKPASPSLPPSYEKPDAIILSHPRSGTHFLQASLASHPKVFTRDEFIRRYAWTVFNELTNLANVKNHIYTNKPLYFNIGIVMYQDVEMFEKLFCPLVEIKVLHLLRDARKVARSFAQMWADNLHYGKDFRYHYGLSQEPLPHVQSTAGHVKDVLAEVHAIMKTQHISNIDGKVDRERLQSVNGPELSPLEKNFEELDAAIILMQRHYSHLLETHPAKFLVSYDEITRNSQVNELPIEFCGEILNFLGLDYHRLTNRVKKTGTA